MKNKIAMENIVSARKQDQLPFEFGEATQELITVLTAFREEQFNTVPPTGGWSAAQVGEHLVKSDSAILKALHGPVKETVRQPNAYVDDINAAFLDFNTKMNAPGIIIPAEDIIHDKETLIMALKSNRDLLGKAIRSLDLSLTCTDPVMSGIVGEWTRQEYINFVISHTLRHINQLKKIHKNLQ